MLLYHKCARLVLYVCAGAVLPVGGVLLAEAFIEPLSGRMVRVGGASIRAGQLVLNAGGYQVLLDNKVFDFTFFWHISKNLFCLWSVDSST